MSSGYCQQHGWYDDRMIVPGCPKCMTSWFVGSPAVVDVSGNVTYGPKPLHVCPPHDLSDAWAAAEAALPEGWHIFRLEAWGFDGVVSWTADAQVSYSVGYHRGDGPTPAAALLDLAERLREVGR